VPNSTVVAAQGTFVGRGAPDQLSMRAPFDLVRADRQPLLMACALSPNLTRPGSLMRNARGVPLRV